MRRLLLVYLSLVVVVFCGGCAAELLGGLEAGDFAALGGESSLATEGLEASVATGEITVANEDVFFGELRKVRIEQGSLISPNPKLYLLENGARRYFAEVLDEGTIRLTDVNKEISMPEGMELYRVEGNNVNVRSSMGEEFKVYRKVNSNDIVLVLRRVGDWYEVELSRNLTGFIYAGLLAKVSSNGPGHARSANGTFQILSPQERSTFDYPRTTTVNWTTCPGASYYLLEVQLSNSPYDYTATSFSPMPFANHGLYLTGLTYQTFQGMGKQVHRFRVIAKYGNQVVGETAWRYVNYSR